MDNPLSSFRKRIVPKDEAARSGKQTDKLLMVEDLAKLFVDPETGESIQVGEAVEFGDFDDPTETVNTLRRYMPDVYRKLEWDQNKTSKTQRVVSIEPKQKDGKFVVWVKRLL